MTGRAARAVALLVLALVWAAPALAADPAVEVLETEPAYVSPAAYGPGADVAEAELAEVAERLTDEDRPVKLAIVPGPAGAPTMQAYTRRLRRQLGYEGTLVVTAPGRDVAVVGREAPAAVTRRLRAAKVSAIADPVERVTVAAEAGTPPRDEAGSGTRDVMVLLAIAALGAAWAVAWGLRRERREARGDLAEMRGWLDACQAAAKERAAVLTARNDLDDAARSRVSSALADLATSESLLRGADDLAAITEALPPLRSSLAALAEAAATVGVDLPPEDPFRGLCTVDPSHGPARSEAPVDGRGDVPVCSACADGAAHGETLRPRLVPTPDGPVPYDEISTTPLAR